VEEPRQWSTAGVALTRQSTAGPAL